MALDYLIVYKSDYPKIRIGSKNDGGYIIADNLDYDCIISCGIADDITFEKNVLNKYPNIPCYSFDGTIEALPEKEDRITFIKKNISYYDSENKTTLSDIIDKYNNILFKMDIESYEFRWLQIMTQERLNKMKQIIIEFHFPFKPYHNIPHFDTDLPVQDKINTLIKISNNHTLIHLHGNNCCEVSLFNNIVVPNIFECTYVRQDIQPKKQRSTDPIPGILDRPNLPGADIILYGYPFTNE